MKRRATAIWKGKGTEGSGTLTTQSKVFNQQPYSFKARFENEDGTKGTNPEELIAAAHAGCFNMALGVQLEKAGYEADELDTDAIVSLEKTDDGFAITGIKLKLKGKVSDVSEEEFMELANNAKKGCPISKALSAVDIELEAEFVSV